MVAVLHGERSWVAQFISIADLVGKFDEKLENLLVTVAIVIFRKLRATETHLS